MSWGRRFWRAARSRRGGALEGAGESIATEVEAYLSGSYRELLERRGEAIPAWAWLNGVAHGSPDRVRRAASERSPYGRAAIAADRAWGGGAGAGGGRRGRPPRGEITLEDLQHEMLIPLELALARDAGVAAAACTAAELSEAISRSLRGALSPIVLRHGGRTSGSEGRNSDSRRDADGSRALGSGGEPADAEGHEPPRN
jgi:hypothetical protein